MGQLGGKTGLGRTEYHRRGPAETGREPWEGRRMQILAQCRHGRSGRLPLGMAGLAGLALLLAATSPAFAEREGDVPAPPPPRFQEIEPGAAEKGGQPEWRTQEAPPAPPAPPAHGLLNGRPEPFPGLSGLGDAGAASEVEEDAAGAPPAGSGLAGGGEVLRPRPPDPPPPGSSIPAWDLDPFGLGHEAPLALPKGDPFPLRDNRWKHDTRVASLPGRRTPLMRLPQWVDVIERDDLVAWRPYDIGFLARQHPNVLIRDGGNPFLELPVVRGLGGDRVKILTDGVWPSTQTLGAQGGTLSLWDPEATERVEIFHGPGAYLKGIDAPGGMINIVPRRPRQHGDWSGDWGARTGYDSATKKWRNRLEVDVGEGRFAALIGATTTSIGHRTTPSGDIEPTDYDQFSGDVAMDYFLTPRSRVGATIQYTKADNIETPFATGTSFSDPSYDRIFAGLTFTNFEMGGFFHGHQTSLSFDSFLQDDDRGLSDVTAGIGSEDDVTRANWHLEGTLNLLCGHETWAELSVGYAHLKRTETLLCVNDVDARVDRPTLPKSVSEAIHTHAEIDDNCEPVSRSFEAEEFIVSALLEDQVHCECWDSFLGLRADFWWIDDTRFDEDEFHVLIGGAAGYTRHLNKAMSLFTNASLGWRRPSIFERTATEIVDGRLLFANEDLDPELHGNAELGMRASYRNRLSLQAAAFAHYIDDTIAPRDLGVFPAAAVLENRGDVWLYGGEALASWRPEWTIEGLEVFGSLGITRSSDTELVGHVPIHYRSGVRYSVPAPKGYRFRRWFAEVAGHGAASWRDGPRSDDAYFTADVLLGLNVDLACGRNASVHMGLTNLLDESYTPPQSTLPAAGLSFFAGFQIDI